MKKFEGNTDRVLWMCVIANICNVVKIRFNLSLFIWMCIFGLIWPFITILVKLFCLFLVLYCVVLYYYFSATTLWWNKDYHLPSSMPAPRIRSTISGISVNMYRPMSVYDVARFSYKRNPDYIVNFARWRQFPAHVKYSRIISYWIICIMYLYDKNSIDLCS